MLVFIRQSLDQRGDTLLYGVVPQRTNRGASDTPNLMTGGLDEQREVRFVVDLPQGNDSMKHDSICRWNRLPKNWCCGARYGKERAARKDAHLLELVSESSPDQGRDCP